MIVAIFKLWALEYTIVSIVALLIAFLFFKTKDGGLRKNMFAMFLCIAWSTAFIAFCGFSEGFGLPTNHDIIRIFAITPILVSLICLFRYLYKNYGKNLF